MGEVLLTQAALFPERPDAGSDSFAYFFVIAHSSQEKNNQMIQRLEQFIAAFDLVVDESQKIDSVLTPLELRQSNPKGKTIYVRTCPIPYEQLIGKTIPLLAQKGEASISEIVEFLSQLPGLEKKHVVNAIQTELLKRDCRIARTGHGKGTRYVLGASVVANGSVPQHVAGAA